jgi:hypothetical protein
MDKESFKQYKKDNPYHVWVYRKDGSKFVGHFQSRKHAMSWAKAAKHPKELIGSETSAGKSRGKRRETGLGFGLFR